MHFARDDSPVVCDLTMLVVTIMNYQRRERSQVSNSSFPKPQRHSKLHLYGLWLPTASELRFALRIRRLAQLRVYLRQQLMGPRIFGVELDCLKKSGFGSVQVSGLHQCVTVVSVIFRLPRGLSHVLFEQLDRGAGLPLGQISGRHVHFNPWKSRLKSERPLVFAHGFVVAPTAGQGIAQRAMDDGIVGTLRQRLLKMGDCGRVIGALKSNLAIKGLKSGLLRFDDRRKQGHQQHRCARQDAKLPAETLLRGSAVSPGEKNSQQQPGDQAPKMGRVADNVDPGEPQRKPEGEIDDSETGDPSENGFDALLRQIEFRKIKE